MAQAMGYLSPIQNAQAPLVVLEGADMPAIVVEVGYLTHPDTEKKLDTPTYQRTLAHAIAQGINAYFDHQAAPSRQINFPY